MSTPPLNRDQQIAMMQGARERRVAVLARWSKDTGIERMLRQTVTRSEAHTLEQADEYMERRRA